MQGKGARGRKRLVALCSVEGTKLLGGPCCASGWGVLVEGLGAGERDLARQASQETEKILATYLLDGLGDQVRRCFVLARRWERAKRGSGGLVNPELVELGGHAGTDGVVQVCYSPRAV